MGALKHKVVSAAGACLRTLSNDKLLTSGGQVFDMSPGLDDYNRCALFAGRYEKYEIRLLKKHFQPDHTIIEIGANIGVVARYAFTQKLKAGGSYICVEPNPNSHVALEANMRRSQTMSPGRNYQIIMAAVAGLKSEGKSEEFIVRSNLGSRLASQIEPLDEDIVVRVPSRSLSGLLKEYAPQGASLICDTEGAEIPMILEDGDAFANIRQIVIELHEPSLTGRPETPVAILARLKQLGFMVGDGVDNCYYLSRSR